MLQRPRQERRDLALQIAGNHYSDDGPVEEIPLNLLNLYISIVGRNLIAKDPRVLLSVKERQYKPMVSAMQSWANSQIQKMRLGDTLYRIVIDALLSVGIAKVALGTPADAASKAWNLNAGAPFVDRVDLDDFVMDMQARDFSEVSYIGHRFRVPLEVVRDSKIYNKNRLELTASERQDLNEDGDERIGKIGRGNVPGYSEDFEDFVDLWEVYLPRHRIVLTLPGDYVSGIAEVRSDGDDGSLREQPWLGSDNGPYLLLGLGIVPGNLLPKGPMQDLADLHLDYNTLMRKIIRQAKRQKSLTGYAANNPEDAKKTQEVSDGDFVPLARPESMQQIEHGGANANNVQVCNLLKELFSWGAGNLEMMGGLSPQSKTLGQDRMLAENASRGVADMQDRTIAFTAEVLKALCWYWHNDPFKTMKTTHCLPGMPAMQIMREVDPAQRAQCSFEDLDVSVDPYSLQHQTPQSKMTALTQLVTQLYMPFAPQAMQQGVNLDFNALFKMAAQYLDMPDLPDLLTIQQPPKEESTLSSESPGKPAQTERKYVRENVSTQTSGAKNEQSIAAMMGFNTGGAQRNGKVPMGA